MGLRGPQAKLPQGELKEIKFTMYVHKQLVTVGPQYGVMPLECSISLERAKKSGHWYIQELDRGDFSHSTAPRGKTSAAMFGYDPAAFLLGAMIALHQEGIDATEVKGWYKRATNGFHVERALETFGQWRRLYA